MKKPRSKKIPYMLMKKMSHVKFYKTYMTHYISIKAKETLPLVRFAKCIMYENLNIIYMYYYYTRCIGRRNFNKTCDHCLPNFIVIVITSAHFCFSLSFVDKFIRVQLYLILLSIFFYNVLTFIYNYYELFVS
jgi:hypothetical protein